MVKRIRFKHKRRRVGGGGGYVYRPRKRSRYYKKGHRGSRGIPLYRSGGRRRGGSRLTRTIRRVARSNLETHISYQDLFRKDQNPIRGIGTHTYDVWSEGVYGDSKSGEPIVIEYKNNGWSSTPGEDKSYVGKKVFIKGFSVMIDWNEANAGQNDNTSTNYGRCMRLMAGPDSTLDPDDLNSCFHCLSANDATGNMMDHYSSNSLACHWENKAKWNKYNDTGWFQYNARLQNALAGTTVGAIIPDEPPFSYTPVPRNRECYTYPHKQMKYYVKVNQEYQVQANGTLLGWIPQFICLIYTGVWAPDICVNINMYWQDA